MIFTDFVPVKKNYLYEGLDLDALHTVKLWESAGHQLVEAALTQQQIQQIFANIEQDVTAAGKNRTMIGQGKDAAAAVSKAWGILKDKIYNSKPMSNFASAYDEAAEKLKKATGGDAGAMKYVQKYRDFATKNPMLQSAIYAALIAASGISGVGLGGAAALGLFKLVDQAIQGKDIRSAAWSGLKTGGMAYAAGQIGQAMKGGEVPTGSGMDSKFADVNTTMPDGTVLPTDSVAANVQSKMDVLKDLGLGKDATYGQVVQAMKKQGWPDDWISGTTQDAGKHAVSAIDTSGYTSTATGQTGDFGQPTYNLTPTTPAQDFANLDNASLAQSMKMNPMLAQRAGMPGLPDASSVASGITGDQMVNNPAYQAVIQKFGDTPGARRAAMAAAKAAISKGQMNESINLTESQIYLMIGKIVERQRKLDEGIMDTIKGAASKAAGKAANWAKTKGTNLTTKITADKLLQAWKKADSPTDSLDVAKVIQTAGVPSATIKQVYNNMRIPFAGEPGAQPNMARKIDVDSQPTPTATTAPTQDATAQPDPAALTATNTTTKSDADKSAVTPASGPDAAVLPTPSKTTSQIPVATGAINPATGQAWLPSELKAAKAARDAAKNQTSEPTATDSSLPTTNTLSNPAPTKTPVVSPAVSQQDAIARTRATKQAAAAANAQAQMAPNASAKTTPADPVAAARPLPLATSTSAGQPSSITYKGIPGLGAKKPTTNFAQPGFTSYKTSTTPTTTTTLPKPTTTKISPAIPAAPAAPKVTSGGPTPAEQAKLAQRIAQAVKQPVAEMLRMVETKEDIKKIKQFVDQTFVKYNAVSESAFIERNKLIEHITHVGAQQRREFARKSS